MRERYCLDSNPLAPRWIAFHQVAKAFYAEAYRERVLRSQVGAWQEAKATAAYVDALEHAYGDQPEAADWIS